MKVGIMQPYFFPYIGYFSLINSVDKFILLEDVQFIKRGWIERNRILSQNSEWNYIKVPLKKHSQNTLICDIKIKNDDNWKEKILSQLVHYKKNAKYYFKTIELVKECLSIQTDSITELNKHILVEICNYLDIKTDIIIFDSKNTPIIKPNSPDEWALNICLSLGNIHTYMNPEGGKIFFDTQKYKSKNIDIKFIKQNLKSYDQSKAEFIEGLSIIDLLMFNSKEEVKNMLCDYTYV
ncbi:hypothetical protein TPELB_11410 [Terrisporobacter petrolearius]|uniref:Glycine transferase n=2 Tax=Terrisporobacter petrolearius TaxID=1460447 RepID=A0ABZ3FCE8_9FIRM